MKSKMVTDAIYIKQSDKKNYSDLQVLQSAAGYYIGTLYSDPETGFVLPGSRDTQYFQTEKEASIQLGLLEKGQSELKLREWP